MKDQLLEYKTTIKVDEKILRSETDLSFNLRNCIEIRLGEKRVLDYFIKMSKKMIDYFAHRKKVNELNGYETYLREIFNASAN